MMGSVSRARIALVLVGLTLVLVLSMGVGLLVGPTPLSQIWQAHDHFILWEIRLPRLVLGLLVGMALSTAGAAFQALLRNPLADPYNLGVSGGAALGHVIALSLGASFWVRSGAAFAAAVTVMLALYSLAHKRGRLSNASLLLAGIVFNAFSMSLIMFIVNIMTPQESQHILLLLIGSLNVESWAVVKGVAVLVVSGFIALWLLAYPLNLLLFGEESAVSLGLSIERYRRLIFFITSLAIAAAVSASGLIGFVGLCIPHMIRLLFGSDHRLLIPASGLLGASFLVLADTLARSLLSGAAYQTELPVGVITTLIGAPIFAVLLKRSRHALS